VSKLQSNPADECDFETLSCSAIRELGAFIAAVTDSFGTEQAQLAADDWVRELNAVPPGELSARTWRMITIASSVRLAARLNTASSDTNVYQPSSVSEPLT
jgi:hypothetical protein